MDKLIKRKYTVELTDGETGIVETEDKEVIIGSEVCIHRYLENDKVSLFCGYVKEILNVSENEVDAVHIVMYSGEEDTYPIKVFECGKTASMYTNAREKKYGGKYGLRSYGTAKFEFVRDKNKKMNFIEAVQYLQEGELLGYENYRKVRHIKYPDDVFVIKYDGGLYIYMEEHGYDPVPYKPSPEEILGEWEVYND